MSVKYQRLFGKISTQWADKTTTGADASGHTSHRGYTFNYTIQLLLREGYICPLTPTHTDFSLRILA